MTSNETYQFHTEDLYEMAAYLASFPSADDLSDPIDRVAIAIYAVGAILGERLEAIAAALWGESKPEIPAKKRRPISMLGR